MNDVETVEVEQSVSHVSDHSRRIRFTELNVLCYRIKQIATLLINRKRKQLITTMIAPLDVRLGFHHFLCFLGETRLRFALLG